MKVQLAVCIFLQGLFAKAEALPGNTANQTHVVPKRAELEYLGFADGKNYFLYPLDLTWDDARIVCREFSMDLASIRTGGQLEFLKTVYSKLVGHEHWIGARDAESPRSLYYLDTGGEVPTFEATSWVYKASSYQVCGAYNPNKDYEAPTPVPELVIFPCLYERPVLCST